MKNLSLIAALLILAGLNTTAQVIEVPADHSTIQAAIDAAEAGDTVLVAEGTYYENINFLGKAITVASHFILDGNEYYRENTVIDGSQSANPDTASVVTMRSGEDTTSVLCGFTLTGGKGTYIGSNARWTSYEYLSGAAVFINHSGGRIENNIMENFILNKTPSVNGIYGGVVFARVSGNHTAILRNNTIRNNTVAADAVFGGPIGCSGGRLIIEDNRIMNNIMTGQSFAIGGAIWFEGEEMTEVIKETCIRNNFIKYNKCIAITTINTLGGAIAVAYTYTDGIVQVYNNVITKNSAGDGGGLYGFMGRFDAFNNTILNNVATRAGNNVHVDPGCTMNLYNNIIWSDGENGKEEFSFWDNNANLRLFNNILKEYVISDAKVLLGNNLYLDPEITDTVNFTLNENSPAVGNGVDSVLLSKTWYYAPVFDLYENKRPDPVDEFIDLGASESSYSRVNPSNADLFLLRLGGLQLSPEFHPDTISYTMGVPDVYTETEFEELLAIPKDYMAGVEITYPTNFPGGNAEECTAGILVTSRDEAVQKTYTVTFDPLSTDATLSELTVSFGEWNQEFTPDVLDYVITLPEGTEDIPETSYTPTDENAEVYYYPASSTVGTTEILVRPEAGQTYQKTYSLKYEGVGVEEQGWSDGIRIYPNPWSNATTLELDDALQVKHVELYNILGERLRNIDHTQGRQFTIERGDLAPGVYFLRVEADRTRTVRMLVQ